MRIRRCASCTVADAPMNSVAAVVSTHCPYCSLQCGMHLVEEAAGLKVLGNAKFPVNEGGLCVKGWSAAATLDHPDRLRTPLVRDNAGQLVAATWDEALARIAAQVRATQQQFGADAVAVFGGGSLTN